MRRRRRSVTSGTRMGRARRSTARGARAKCPRGWTRTRRRGVSIHSCARCRQVATSDMTGTKGLGAMAREMDEETARGLGKIAYERFAEERMARGQVIPPWTDAPRGQGLPHDERTVWIEVALAVAEHLPFVIDEETLEA